MVGWINCQRNEPNPDNKGQIWKSHRRESLPRCSTA